MQEPGTELLYSPAVTSPGTSWPQAPWDVRLPGLKPCKLLHAGQVVALLLLSNEGAA